MCHLLDCRWERYRTLYSEQEEMNSNGLLWQVLARGLKNMQNLSSIVLSPNLSTVPVEEESLGDMVPTEYYPSQVGLTNTAPPDHPFRQLIYAIFMSQRRGIRQLTIREPRYGERTTRFSLYISVIQNPHDMHAAKYVFSHLTKLELQLYIPHPDVAMRFPSNVRSAEQSPQKLLAHLSELLQTAQDLQHLSLAIPLWRRWAAEGGERYHRRLGLKGRSMFYHLGLGGTWPMLRSLSLQGLYGTKQDLVDFMGRHRDTLKVLKFSCCSLYDGFWADIVDEVIFNAPMISTFVLDLVDEFLELDYDEDFFLTWEEKQAGRYEGYMRTGADGKREFVCHLLGT